MDRSTENNNTSKVSILALNEAPNQRAHAVGNSVQV